MNMKRFFSLFLIFGSLTCHAQETDIVAHLVGENSNGWFESISVTSTGIVFQTRRPLLYSLYEKNSPPLRSQYKDRIPEQQETIILTPNFEIFFGDGHHVTYLFTPVTFKNNLEGFRVFQTFFPNPASIKIWYVALSDVPVPVEEEDLTDESRELSNTESKWKKEIEETQQQYEELRKRMEKEKEEFFENLKTNQALALYYSDRRKMIDKYTDMIVQAQQNLQGDELQKRLSEIRHAQELEMEQFQIREEILFAPPPLSRPASRGRAWLWWLALPVVAGAWFAFHRIKRRR